MTKQNVLLFQSDAFRLGRSKFAEIVDDKLKQIDAGSLSTSYKLINNSGNAGGKSPTNRSLLARRSRGREKVGRSQAIKPYLIGIWDLNSLAADFSKIAVILNRVQNRFRFFEISGAVPAGLVSGKTRILAWLREHNQSLSRQDRQQVDENTISEDFYPQARKLRTEMALTHLIGITSSMIAFDDDGVINYNYFASYEEKRKRELLVSSYGLNRYALEAGRPLEAALGGVLISILLVSLNSRLSYHPNTGCLFDFNEERDAIVNTIREARIGPECMQAIRSDMRPAAQAMVRALKGLKSGIGRRGGFA